MNKRKILNLNIRPTSLVNAVRDLLYIPSPSNLRSHSTIYGSCTSCATEYMEDDRSDLIIVGSANTGGANWHL